MKWDVTGADRQSGQDKTLVVEADTKESAVRRAGRQGLLVADAVPQASGGPAATKSPPKSAARPAPAAAPPRACGNCDRPIGKLEPTYQHNGHVVCAQCNALLTPVAPAAVKVTVPVQAGGVYVPPAGEYRALGLGSRKMACIIAICGLLTSWAGVGVLLLIWGLVADHMLAKHAKQLKKAEAATKKAAVPTSLELRGIHANVRSLSMD